MTSKHQKVLWQLTNVTNNNIKFFRVSLHFYTIDCNIVVKTLTTKCVFNPKKKKNSTFDTEAIGKAIHAKNVDMLSLKKDSNL